MTQMKLPRQADRRASDFTISLASDLRIALQKYADLYRATYGEEIPLTELIPAMLAEFLEADGAFARKHAFVGIPYPAALHRTEVTPPNAQANDAVERLIPLKEVCRLIGVGKSMIYKMIQQGRFPAPYKPSAGAARWSDKEVLNWIANIRSQRSSSMSTYLRPERLS
ncbi:excisionase family DNA binding protein [Sphingomonas vulcanisoli]|uniref:Excisionase family DNA binding protein n=1 Tax=Sphingomonas vulcanisoli TaxID=1658060 RepID=A0ABX0TVL2_9SPHN|nr:DUF2274 domain-containing protein [Sphingomonas vulcanisoli]NIJ09538.1 excisionase family DNA binding protein [Sphingomonas vulcanisoli]